MSLPEDLSVFFSTAEFAESVTLNGQPAQAIFDNGFALGAVGLAGMAGVQPTLTLPTASVPASPIGVAAVVNATNYLVAAHEPDGTGVSRLLLERA